MHFRSNAFRNNHLTRHLARHLARPPARPPARPRNNTPTEGEGNPLQPMGTLPQNPNVLLRVILRQPKKLSLNYDPKPPRTQ